MTVADLHDIKLDENRQVFVGADGDLALTEGVGTVEQSVAIEAGQVLRPLVGEPITGSTFEDVQAELQEILSTDPQVENVNRVDIVSVNRSTSTVDVEVFVEHNNSFTLSVDAA